MITPCDNHKDCLNYPDSCYKCFDRKFLKTAEDKTRQQRMRKKRTLQQKPGEKSWRYKERLTAAKLSAVPAAAEMESRINPGSGNQIHRPGDILDDVLHVEVKERKPSFTTKGKKHITIELAWLKDAIEEVRGINKFPVVTFSPVGDNHLYALMDFEDLANLAHEVKYLRNELIKVRQNRSQ